jgi:hypothetical protein
MILLSNIINDVFCKQNRNHINELLEENNLHEALQYLEKCKMEVQKSLMMLGIHENEIKIMKEKLENY